MNYYEQKQQAAIQKKIDGTLKALRALCKKTGERLVCLGSLDGSTNVTFAIEGTAFRATFKQVGGVQS